MLERPKTRKLKIFSLTDEAALTLARELYSTQLPENCKIIGVHADWLTRSIKLMVEHESFPEIEEGSIIPTGEMIDA